MTSGSSLSPIERLKLRENYDTCRFAVQSDLEHEDLWHYVSATNQSTEGKKKLDTRTKSKIILLFEPVNYVHVQTAKSAKDVWDNLQKVFQDSGLTGRVTLLRLLTTTRLHDSDSIEDYVNKIISTAHKLRGVGMDVNDEWIGTLLLAGLPVDYRPMIMAIEDSATANGSIKLEHIFTNEMVVDVLTKELMKMKHSNCIQKMGIVSSGNQI